MCMTFAPPVEQSNVVEDEERLNKFQKIENYCYRLVLHLFSFIDAKAFAGIAQLQISQPVLRRMFG